MKTEFHTVYKCRLCGTVFIKSKHSNVSLDVVANGVDPIKDMMIAHSCADGSLGNADFIGIRNVGGKG